MHIRGFLEIIKNQLYFRETVYTNLYLPMKKIILFLSLSLIYFSKTSAQQPNENIVNYRWKAVWIAPQNVNLKAFGVYHFRKNFDLTKKPNQFIINVSGDNRYRIFVNGNYIGAGPARSDLMHWNFETYDVAQQLQEGENTIAAVVWNFGEDMPMAQMSNKTGFIVQGNSSVEEVVNTNKYWKVSTCT